jgi:DNA-binding MarR family transcriptional regulator
VTKGADHSGREQGVAGPRASLRLGELGDRLGFHLRLAHTAMWRDFAAAMARLDLTQRQAGVLELIADNPGVSQVDLAAALVTDRATMMAIVDRLDDRGLVQRRRSIEDRRRQELHLTAQGATMVEETRRTIRAHEARFKGLFTPAELEALTAALKRIHQRF